MEKVQFQQEQMLSELKDLVQKGLFTQVAKKGDFLRYAAYEMGLESLRKKRVERLNLPPSPPSISDYALVRRQFHIFERALKKFKSDVGLWVQYIQVARREGARALVGRITARALQLHPKTPALYILAASHELEHLSPSAARTLLQRGIRLNPDSVEMWREYVKMELGFVEGMRRRWDLLGIKLDAKGKGKERDADIDRGDDGEQEHAEAMDVDDEVDGDAARQEIMNGVIVKSVISSAAKDPEAVKLHATRSLAPNLAGETLIEALKKANEELLHAVKDGGSNSQGLCEAYADFVKEWCQKTMDDHLKVYLITSLQSLASKVNEPSLFAAHLELLIAVSHPSLPAPEKLVRNARKYTTKQSASGAVWLARLRVELEHVGVDDARKAWAEARSKVKGERLEDVWRWGLEQSFGESAEAGKRILEELLKESMRDSCLQPVHEMLLVRYAEGMGRGHAGIESEGSGSDTDREKVRMRVAEVRRIAQLFLPTGRVWAGVFRSMNTGGRSDEEVLRVVYDMWMDTDGLSATLAWGEWLLEKGKGNEAKSVVVRAGRVLGREDELLLEKRWMEVMAGREQTAIKSSSLSPSPGPPPLWLMLQYSVHPPPLSFSNAPKKLQLKSGSLNATFAHNDPSSPAPARRPLTSPSALSQQRPPDDVPSNRLPGALSSPLSISTSISSSSSLPSPSFPPASFAKQVPRPPFMPSSRQQSMAIPTSRLNNAHSRKDSGSSSVIADVLAQGDIVGGGIPLQGEPIRLVSIQARSSVAVHEQPAQEFEVIRKLGTGSYAVVYLVREVLSRFAPSDDDHIYPGGRLELDEVTVGRPSIEYGRDFAIKLLSKANLDEEALAAQMFEATIHQTLPTHSNIVTLHQTLETSSYLLLLLEFVPGEDLFYFLEQARDHFDVDPSDDSVLSSSRTPPTPSILSSLHPAQLLSYTRLRLIASMFSQMCEAVAVCHDTSVFHRDIKPENFIVTDGWQTNGDGKRERKVIVKLSDFGLSTTDVDSSDMDCGSAPYMSYECRNNVAPTYKPRAADVWSLGIVLINMLYHYNPWTDTVHGGCMSFDLYRQQPVNFFTSRFAGMTLPVAHFLADRVFCILGDSVDDSQRISARELGAWARELPSLLGQRPSHNRVPSAASITGHALSSVPPSRRPSSRQASVAGSPFRTSIALSRAMSRAPSLGPAYEDEGTELPPVLNEEVEEGDENDGEVDEPSASRSTSTTKRRKRGARKGKSVLQTAASNHDLTSDMLATASQTLARELSRASKANSINPSTPSSPLPPPSILSPSVVPPPVQPVVVKKASKWRLGFGKGSSDRSASGRASPGVAVAELTSSRSEVSAKPISTTATNVTSILMGLNAPATQTAADDAASTWSRGRQPKQSASLAPSSNASGTWSRSGHSPLPHGQGHVAGIEQWANGVDRRGTSPTSTRSGRPLASSASSMASSNWRSSMSSTNTSTSAFTRYSNPSTRSVSTFATSVSSTSSNWRNGQGKQPGRGKSPFNAAQHPPPNVKIMTGVPWELAELPRQLHPNPVGDIFGEPPVRKQRMRKPKSQKLDTINERPGMSPQKQRVEYRQDAATSTTDLGGLAHDGGRDDGADASPKKVQKGQINALAKMLSALRR
ncbi:hypothetical protein EW146_g4874 [Bondarzewia mesenterica]|uniref:Protein kinase domain-containing protein n=1 Tax=Bondarzewia mesenterica TaxID=1095465 RepID=A0A4S4LYX6_9AGAM|nr:hypothetical protein EW146_g4874 [Bondarzewia mesenterica]